MIVSAATAQALHGIERRESELRAAFTPGAEPVNSENAAGQSLERDISPLSVAVQGNAYFIVCEPSGGELFTHDGAFHIEDGELVNRNGMAVLGLTDGRLVPLRLNAIDTALNRVVNLHIDNRGALVYEKPAIDPSTRQAAPLSVTVGQLALARFSAGTRLDAIDSAHFRAPPAIPPHVGTAADGNFAPLVTHAHERSRIGLLDSIDRLQESYMAFDAFRAAHSAQGRTEKMAMDLLK
ncbi:MAG: hypothetical protein JO193_02345 [Candidatus Eremiobacteraeota bacterium]|nr:hypothetical protein [Candidatus Eremiobacteraeota bacterium]